MSEKKIKGKEAKGVSYFKSRIKNGNDIVVVKEIIHYEDGTTGKNLRIEENYQIPFWVTKPTARNHIQKKASEKLDNLLRYESHFSALPGKVARVLDYKYGGGSSSLKQLSNCPYVYGLDISPVSWMKYSYLKRWPGCTTANEVATLDIETNVNSPDEEIILLTITCKEKLRCYVLRSFLNDSETVRKEINEKANTYLKETLEKRKIQPVVEFHDTPGQLVKAAIEELHRWQPDYLIIWNAIFDMPRLKDALIKENFDPAEVFSDPRIPREYRQFRIKEGKDKLETASGVKKTKSREEIWSWYYFPATFIVLDAMCVYDTIRFGAKEQSYALDYILQIEKIGTKLRIPGTDQWHGLRWHQVVQQRFPVAYLIYNWADCIRMEELNDKTTDISMVINEIAAVSDFSYLNSGPRRLVDKMHFWYLDTDAFKDKRIMASAPNDWDEEHDRHVIGHRNIIVTLPAMMLAPCTIDHVKDTIHYATLTFKFCYDADVTSTYPTASIVLNASPETRRFEFSRIRGVEYNRRIALGINLTAPRTNAMLICTEYFGAAKASDWLKEWDATQGGIEHVKVKECIDG